MNPAAWWIACHSPQLPRRVCLTKNQSHRPSLRTRFRSSAFLFNGGLLQFAALREAPGCSLTFPECRRGGIGRRAVLRGQYREVSRFDSGRRHQSKKRRVILTHMKKPSRESTRSAFLMAGVPLAVRLNSARPTGKSVPRSETLRETCQLLRLR